MSALSVPLFGADQRVRYSLNIVMPTARARGRIVPLLRVLRDAGRKVSLGLGAFNAPDSAYAIEVTGTAGSRHV